MARETITDLLYQYIRAVVHSGFRDGMLSGARDAMGLPAPEEIDQEQVAEKPNRVGERAGNNSHAPRTLPGAPLRQLPNHPPKESGHVHGEKRGRGRPRKYPPKNPAGEKTNGEKSPRENSDEGGAMS